MHDLTIRLIICVFTPICMSYLSSSTQKAKRPAVMLCISDCKDEIENMQDGIQSVSATS